MGRAREMPQEKGTAVGTKSGRGGGPEGGHEARNLELERGARWRKTERAARQGEGGRKRENDWIESAVCE